MPNADPLDPPRKTLDVDDHAAIARAEKLLADLAPDYGRTALEEVNRLRLVGAGCRLALGGGRADKIAPAWDELRRTGADIRDVAASYGFAPCTEVADSLCRVLDAPHAPDHAVMRSVDAHLDLLAMLFAAGPAAHGAPRRARHHDLSGRLARLRSMATAGAGTQEEETMTVCGRDKAARQPR